MFTTVAWFENIDAAAAYTPILACADQHIRISGDHIYLGDLNQIVGVYASSGGTSLAAYLSSPSLRRVALYDIMPVEVGIIPATHGAYAPFPQNPLSLMKNEGLDIFIKATDGTASNKFGVVHLSDGVISPVGGEIFSVWGDITGTGVAGSWVNMSISFRQTLPVGKYQVVGAACFGASLVSFRFVPIGAVNRPGGIGLPNVGIVTIPEQRRGGFGVWCEFDSVTPPTIDILSNATTSVHDIVIDLIKVG